VPENRFTNQTLIAAVASHLDLPARDLRLTRCSTGKYNITFFVEGGPHPLVLRIAPEDERRLNLFYEHRMMRQEPELHQEIRTSTSVSIPAIIAHDFSRKLLERDFLIMEKAPGSPLSESFTLSRREFNRVLCETGEALRAVHAIQRDRYGYLGEHRPMKPQASWTEAFVIMWNKLLDDIENCGGYDAREAGAMRKLLDLHIGAFSRSVPSSLLHMDVWAQNILIDANGHLASLLDWDRALWGDPEIEFAVLDYCGISEPAFWEGYVQKRENDTDARIRRIFYLLYELQKYIFIRRVRGNNPSLAERYCQQSLQLAGSIGLRL